MADGTLKVGTITTSSGSGTITLGQSGETLALGSGVTSQMNQPAFFATMGTSDQTVTDVTLTKVQLSNEVIDTNNSYDPTTNYRFTIPSGGAGKYFIFGSVTGNAGANSTLDIVYCNLYKNGSNQFVSIENFRNNQTKATTAKINVIMDLSVGDYIELFGLVDVTSGTPSFDAGTTAGTIKSTYFGAYRIGA